MNIYKGIRIPESFQTPDHLVDTAQRYADSLAAGRWRQNTIHKVNISRTIADTMGREAEFEGYTVLPVYNEVSISFSAIKRFIEDGTFSSLVPQFSIKSTVEQEIEKKEIPPNILEAIMRSRDEDDDSDDSDNLMYDTRSGDEDLGMEDLDDLQIMRVQEDEYSFNYLGEIEEYTTLYMYTFDDVVVNEVGFHQKNDDSKWNPVWLHNGVSYENKPSSLKTLSEQSLDEEIVSVDNELRDLLVLDAHPELEQLSTLPKEEHIRRILGMISLVSDGTMRPVRHKRA